MHTWNSFEEKLWCYTLVDISPYHMDIYVVGRVRPADCHSGLPFCMAKV